jgi:hypothetical protein
MSTAGYGASAARITGLAQQLDAASVTPDLALGVAAALLHEVSGLASRSAARTLVRHDVGDLAHRSVEDFARLLDIVAGLGKTLLSPASVSELIARRGTEQAMMFKHLEMAADLDRALATLVELMQYATPDRVSLQLEEGWELRSGSMYYGRMVFGAPEKPHA